MAKKKRVYRIVFHNQGKVYELYARGVKQDDLFGFIQVSEIIFGERTALLVDPSEERLKSEFEGVKQTYIPMHAVIRIDEVEREGTNKVVGDSDGSTNVTPFPVPMYGPGSNDPPSTN